VDFDAGKPDGTGGDGQCQPLQQRKLHLDVEPLSLKGGEPVGNGEELRAHRAEMIEAFFQAEVSQIVGTDFVAQKSGKLLVLLDERVPAIGAKDVMAMLDLFERCTELASGLNAGRT